MTAADEDRYAERVHRLCVPIALRPGGRVWIGPLLPDDRDLLSREYATLSPESKWNRFLAAVPELTPSMLDQLVDEVDGVDHVALVAFLETQAGPVPAGVGRLVRYPDHPGAADMAFTVKDEYQGRGIATALARSLVARAPEGVTRILTEVAHGNLAPLAILGKLGSMQVFQSSEGVVDVEVKLAGHEEDSAAESTCLHRRRGIPSPAHPRLDAQHHGLPPTA